MDYPSLGWSKVFTYSWFPLYSFSETKRGQSTHRAKKWSYLIIQVSWIPGPVSQRGYSPYRRRTVLNVVPKPMLYIRVRKSDAVKVTEVWKGARRKPTQCYQPDELYRTVTHSCLKSRQWEATCLSSSSSSSSSSFHPFSSSLTVRSRRSSAASCRLLWLPRHFFSCPSHEVRRPRRCWFSMQLAANIETSTDLLTDVCWTDRRARVKRLVLYRVTIARMRESCRWLFDLAKGNGTFRFAFIIRSNVMSMTR